MPHSHMPVQHLLRQVELYRSRREDGRQQDVRPDWLTQFIESCAELFEPLAEDARAGFDCRLVDDVWVLEMYLGGTEIVGGPDDGQLRYSNFQFNLHGLLDRFDDVDRFRWNAIPDCPDDADGNPRSSLLVSGRIEDNALRMHVYSVPPEEAGPGFREYEDGRREPV